RLKRSIRRDTRRPVRLKRSDKPQPRRLKQLGAIEGPPPSPWTRLSPLSRWSMGESSPCGPFVGRKFAFFRLPRNGWQRRACHDAGSAERHIFSRDMSFELISSCGREGYSGIRNARLAYQLLIYGTRELRGSTAGVTALFESKHGKPRKVP